MIDKSENKKVKEKKITNNNKIKNENKKYSNKSLENLSEETKKEYFMKLALKQAKKAYEKLEIPVGAIIVKDNKVISKAYNLKELKNDTTKHAEILAIQKASKKLNSWRLENCEMYVTLEPCSMCAGAIIQARLKKIYIGAMDYKTGACGSVLNLFNDYKFNHYVECENGILKEECSNILKQFFKELRKNKKINKN